jgi:hypothetical protein
MRRKSAKNELQGKGHAVSRPRSGGLTCTESQLDDVFSAGESTEEEGGLYPPTLTQRRLQ